MQMAFRIYLIIQVILISSLVNSCVKKDVPEVETRDVFDITYRTAVSGGNVTNEGSAGVSARGLCWNTTGSPTISDSTAEGGMGPGPFQKNITNLIPGIRYYLRAYATNNAGTGYGNEVVFKTTTIELPVLTTYVPAFKAQTTIFTGGLVTAFNGGYVSERGVCWSISPNPTTASVTKASENLENHNFYITIEGLTVGATYYLRAYAITEAGTGYGNEIKFTVHVEGTKISDIDENVYSTIKIGTQIWMAENLRTTKLNDGTPITNIKNGYWEDYLPAYCWYNNDEVNYKSTYGGLYNYDAMKQHDDFGVCPVGWRVPDESEWSILSDYLGGEEIAGGKLKETGTDYWLSPNSEATNESGFTGLPGGSTNFQGAFSSIGISGFWWSSGQRYIDKNYYLMRHSLSSSNGSLLPLPANSRGGYSIRCIRDY